jgi:epoxyqueuosine reductase QueG
MGNDTALSIPLAIDAGLGELGRNGLLITPQYGPCVRLCKVFTDLPLMPDQPISFGVTETCMKCFKCAEACEVEAISSDPEPSYRTVSPSNNQGIVRWAVDHDKCYAFWIENSASCATCIAACPFTQRANKAP